MYSPLAHPSTPHPTPRAAAAASAALPSHVELVLLSSVVLARRRPCRAHLLRRPRRAHVPRRRLHDLLRRPRRAPAPSLSSSSCARAVAVVLAVRLQATTSTTYSVVLDALPPPPSSLGRGGGSRHLRPPDTKPVKRLGLRFVEPSSNLTCFNFLTRCTSSNPTRQ